MRVIDNVALSSDTYGADPSHEGRVDIVNVTTNIVYIYYKPVV